jgi:ABC-2 type transport system ATP-binding protein
VQDSAIVVDHLRVVRRGTVVLPDFSASIASGRVTGLLGPSGSGKSTLMRAIVGVQTIASGSVRVLGAEAGSPELRARLGYRPQAPAVYADLTVAENVRYFGRLLGADADGIDGAIATVGLERHRDDAVHRLSGGEQARVSLASVLVGRPDVLVLDEPTVGLDPLLRRELWAMFHRLTGGGATLLVSSHVMDEADNCDDLLLVRDGRLVASGSPEELRARTGARDLGEAFVRLIEEPAA